MINFDPQSQDLPFDANRVDHLDPGHAEESIVQAIIEGSGGPANMEMTEAGLRFVRHLLAQSASVRCGFIPNFKNMETVRRLARRFIHRCGGTTQAINQMLEITS